MNDPYYNFTNYYIVHFSRVLKNRSDPVPSESEIKKNTPVIAVADKRESVHSCNGAIRK